MKHFTRNSPLLKIKVVALMLLILVSSILFALQSQPIRHVTPDAVVMRRESLTLDEALDKSLAMGDGRWVDWSGVV